MSYPYMGQAGGAGPGQTGSAGALVNPAQQPQYVKPGNGDAQGAPLLPGVTQLRYRGRPGS